MEQDIETKIKKDMKIESKLLIFGLLILIIVEFKNIINIIFN